MAIAYIQTKMKGNIMCRKWGKLTEDWLTIDEIIVYCFGPAAEVVFDKINSDIDVRFIIDNNPDIYGKCYKGIPIYSYEQCKSQIGKTKIVITAEAISGIEVAKSLEAEGYCENEDFTMLERFVSEWYYKRFSVTNLLEVHTSVTTRCTFNCKYCNIFMPYFKERTDFTFEQIKINIDLLFQHIDYVFKYQLIGGEPLLHKDLYKVLLYLQENYREKIGMIRIVTNGGIIPSTELIKAMKKCECYVLVSNYTHSIPYTSRYENVKRLLDENKIKYRELVSQKWREYGFPENPRNFPDNKVREHMLTCATFWHGLADEKLYYCNCTWGAEKADLYKPQETDYIKLTTLKDNEDSKIEILKFVLGDRYPNYYNSFCKLCGGCGLDNPNFVISGEQVK